MKKMIPQRLVIIASCIIACFLFSCEGSNKEEKLNFTDKDSINKTSKDSEISSDTNDSLIFPKTNPSLNTANEIINNLSELNKRLNKKPSYFVIKTNRDTVIKCKEGTLLSIPADAFLTISNKSSVVGEVKISVKEFYKISDMMMQGLTTTSNNQLLETGGMINIKVTSKENNDSCILKPKKNIVIALANSDTTNVDRMQLFNGVHGNNPITWAPQNGAAGLAQSWISGRNNFSQIQVQFPLATGFVFPDVLPKIKPLLINSNPENLQAEVKIPLRDLMQYVGLVTKKANGYIDTSGNLNCYKIGYHHQKMSFTELYSPTTYQNMKVNLAVDVDLTYKSNLNHEYYQKLFKMGKGNPDSLVTLTATLNPTIKMTGFEKLKTIYEYALTVKEYQKKQRYRNSLIQEYEKRLKRLRLNEDEKLAKLENSSTTNIQSAQNYLLLSTPQLGWINCDRFYNNPNKVDCFVKLKEKASLLIVFNSIKSIMSSDMNGAFSGVPLNEKITLVGLKTDNGKLMMAFHETTVTEQPFEGLSFKPVTVKEYKSRLEKLNRL
jgi:hypothetical protein